MVRIQEHSVSLDIDVPVVVNASMDIFYNPIMVSNRNISIALLSALGDKDMKIADVMAGSGIRSLRFLQEIDPAIVSRLVVNDSKLNFAETFSSLCSDNGVKVSELVDSGKVQIRGEDANDCLLYSKGFDYIEIDPFGTPNPFLYAAIARISRSGILAVTATDTAALTGTYSKVTLRKYWAKSLKNYMMHETGLRILIRKIQLLGMQFDKALVPVLSYHKDHYFRIYLRCVKGKETCDEIVREHAYLLWCRNCLNYGCSLSNQRECCAKKMEFAGPLFVGMLGDPVLLARMVEQKMFAAEQLFLEQLLREVDCPAGFFQIHQMCRILKIDPPKLEIVLSETGGVRTHFDDTGVKGVRDYSQLREILLRVAGKK